METAELTKNEQARIAPAVPKPDADLYGPSPKRGEENEKGSEKNQAGDRGKIGAGVPPKGVFKRIAAAEKASGEKRIIRHTSNA